MSTHNIGFCEKIRKISVLFTLTSALSDELCHIDNMCFHGEVRKIFIWKTMLS